MKNKGKKLKKFSFIKNVTILLITHIVIKIIGIVYKVYLTNKEGFGDEGNAIYSSAFQIYALLLTICSMGIPNAISKLVSERLAIGDSKGAHKVFKIALITFGTVGFGCSMFLFFFANTISCNWLQIPEAELSLLALSPSIFFVSITAVVKGYFNGRENLNVGASSQTIEQIFKVIATIVLVEVIASSTGLDTRVMAAGAAIATTMSEIVCFMYLYKYYKNVRKEIGNEIRRSVNYKYRGIRKTIKDILCVSIPMSIAPILGGINKNIDSMTIVRGLKNFLSETEAKTQYGILTGKVDTLVAFPLSFNSAFTSILIPAVSAAKSSGNFEAAKRKIKFSMLIGILIGLPSTVGMIIFAKPILELLFPNQPDGEFLLQISSISIVFIMLQQTVNAVLQGLGKTFTPAISIGVGILVKFILNNVLVPINPEKFILGGAAGAAFATVACLIVTFLIDFGIMLKNIDIKIEKKILLKLFLSVAMMAICSVTIYNYILSIFSKKMCTLLILMISVLVYILLVLVLRVFSEENIKMLPYGKKIYDFLKFFKIYN